MNAVTSDPKAIFFAALDQPSPAERSCYLDAACGGDPDLRFRVEQLLTAHDQAGHFLGGAGATAATNNLPLTERPGTQIGPYKLLQMIGEGGMGTVFLAEQAEPVQRTVALKVIKPGMDSRQVIARFEAERQALAIMDHINIARVLDAGSTQSGRPYFVMELVHGVPITTYCDDNHLTPRQRLELFVPVCHAIQHAHQKGIIHRDIKPSNVMVTLYDGKPAPKVIDFGVAKATEQKLTERTLFTQCGTLVGTLEYMSPEQAAMSVLGIDTRSDIYSLGVLLYELLTGSTPLSRQQMKDAAYGEILRLIKEVEPQKPSTRLSESGEALASISALRQTEPARLSKLVRGELDWIVMKTLEKDRNRRYETANAFAADVLRYLNDEPVQACPPSAGYRCRKFAWRHRVALTTLAIISMALLSGTVVSTWQAIRAQHAEAGERKQRTDAVDARQQAVADRDLALQAEEQARGRLYEARLAQAQASRWSGRVGQRFESLKALKEASQIARTLSETDKRLGTLRDEAIACLALPDVQLIKQWDGVEPSARKAVVFDAELAHYATVDYKHGYVRICTAGDGREVARLSNIDKRIFSGDRSFTFNPHADHITTHDSRNRLSVWDWRQGVCLFTTPYPATAHSFSPDGLQFAVGQENGTIAFYDLATSKEVGRIRAIAEPFVLAFHPDGSRLAVASHKSKEVAVYEVATGKLVQQFSGHPDGVWHVAWHPRGHILATASGDNAYLWDVDTGRQQAILQGHHGSVVNVAFLPSGDLLFSSSWDGTLRLWEAATGRFLLSVPGGFVGFNRAGDRVAIYTGGNEIGLWEVAAGREYRLLSSRTPTQRSTIADGSISPGGRWLAVAEVTGVRLWDLALQQEQAFLKTGFSNGVAFHPKEEALFTAGVAGVCRWPIEQEAETLRIGPPRQLLQPGSSPLGCPRLDATGRLLAVVDHAGGQIVNLEPSADTIPRLPHGVACNVAVSPDGRWIATGTHNGFGIKVWEAKTGQLARELLPDVRSSSTTFSPDGRWLAISTNVDVSLWEVGSWQSARLLAKDLTFSSAQTLAFAPSGKTLALSTARDLVQLVDPATGRRFAQLQSPETSQLIAFSADCQQLFVRTGRSPLVRVWDLALIGEQLQEMGLAWELPVLAPARTHEPSKPVQVQVDLGEDSRRLADLAATSLSRGLTQQSTGRHTEAAHSYEQALALWQSLAEKDPEEERYQSGLATTYHNLGYLRSELNQPLEAARYLQQALTIREQLAQEHPESIQFKLSLARTYGTLGNRLREAHKQEDALALHDKGLALFRELVQTHGTRTDFEQGIGTALNSIGDTHRDNRRQAGWAEKALAAYGEAQALQQRLVQKHPTLIAAQSNLANTLINTGQVHQAQKNYVEALQAFEAAIALLDRMLRVNPNGVNDLSSLGMAYGEKARVLASLERPDDAAATYQIAVDHHEKLVRLAPSVKRYQTELASFRQELERMQNKD